MTKSEASVVVTQAESETDLSNIYENLSTKLVFKAEQTELTAWFTASLLPFCILWEFFFNAVVSPAGIDNAGH